MNTSLLAYGVAVLLLFVALRRSAIRVKIGRMTGNLMTGNARDVTQIFNAGGGPAQPAEPKRDYIGWIIGIAGVLIMAAQFAHDLYK